MYGEKFDAILDRYGQSFVLHKWSNVTLCPGFDAKTGYCDPQYHRENPEAPQCNEDGYIDGTQIMITGKAFIQPLGSTSMTNRHQELERYLSTVGEIEKDDYLYIGSADIDISSLNDGDYLEHDSRYYRILNPDPIKIGDETVYVLALLRLRS